MISFTLAGALALVASMIPHSALAIPESTFSIRYHRDVMAYYEGQGVNGSFPGEGGIGIRYRAFQPAGATDALVILPGRAEAAIKYAEVVYDLRALGLAIYVLDHRGQGWSGRMTSDFEIGHVEQFDDYVKDLKTFHDRILAPRGYPKTTLLGHSMGGAIAAAYGARYPRDFDGLVLSSAMLELHLKDGSKTYSNSEALALVWTLRHFAGPEAYGQGQGNYDFFISTLQPKVTHSDIRYEQMIRTYDETTPKGWLKTGGPSNQWMWEVLRFTRHSAELASGIRVRTLMLVAGDDPIVKSDSEVTFCRKLGSLCELETFPSSRHEILMETDSIRTPALARIRRFLGR